MLFRSERQVFEQKREQIIFDRWYHDHVQVKWTLQNFKKEDVILTIEENLDGGEWTLDEVTLMEESGERELKAEKKIDASVAKATREHAGLLKVEIPLPPMGEKKIKWNLYVRYTLRNRGF